MMVFISNGKLHVSAYSGHHQVLYNMPKMPKSVLYNMPKKT